MAKTTVATLPPLRRLSADEAFVALIIAAMEANDHSAPEEAQRAQHIVHSMSRFRKRGDAVGRLIFDMKQMRREHAPDAIIAAACRAIPPRLRKSAFAIVADIILADRRLQGIERRFLSSVAKQLEQTPADTNAILDAIRIRRGA